MGRDYKIKLKGNNKQGPKLSSKDCSEVSSFMINGMSTLPEKQYLAKQQSFINKIT